MTMHLILPPRHNLVALITALLDKRFNIRHLVLIDWSAENIEKLLAFTTSRAITTECTDWHGWAEQCRIAQQANSSQQPPVWLLADHFSPQSWQAEQQALNSGLQLAAIEGDFWHWLWGPEQGNHLDLADNLKLEQYIALFNWQLMSLERRPLAENHVTTAGYWARRVQHGQRALATLNSLATNAAGKLHTTLSSSQRRDPLLNTFIDELASAGMASIQQGKLTFRDEDARFFANGGWLEELIFDRLQKLRRDIPKLQDVARNVEIVQSMGSQSIVQELDVVCLYDNRLIIIECKTRNFHKKNASVTASLKLSLAALAAMKKTLGPPVAKMCFISFFSLSDSAKARAAQWNVDLISGSDLSQIDSELKRMLTG